MKHAEVNVRKITQYMDHKAREDCPRQESVHDASWIDLLQCAKQVAMPNRIPLTALTAALALLAGLAAPRAQGGDPFEVYKTYLAAFAKADSLEGVLSFYTKELRTGLAKMPKDQQANYMKMQVGAQKLTALTVTKRSVDATKATFEMTAKTGDGRSISGSATLIKEGSDWKIDDEAWALPPPRD